MTLASQGSYASPGFLGTRLLADDGVPWQITAKSLTYNEKQESYVAEGDVVITKGNQFLYSQEAVYDVKTGTATVSGDVRLEAGGDILTAEQGFFDLNKKTGRFRKGRLFLSENHYYISGESMEKMGEDTYLIKDCHLTTCDDVTPAWTITGSEVEVTIEGYGEVKHAAFRVRGLPISYVPYMIFPAKTKRQSGLLPPKLGYSSLNGTDTEIPFFWAISDQTDATFYQRLMGKRGYMQGVEFRYLADVNSKGIFLFDILSDNKQRKDMNNPDDVEISPYERTNSTRYWFRSRLDQDLPLGVVARLDTDYVSDQDYLREFQRGLFGLEARPDFGEESGRSLEEEYSPTRRSALRLSRDQEEYSLQALSSYHQKPENPAEDDTPQPLAGLNFILLPEQKMNLPIFLSLESDYDYVWRDVGQKGHRMTLSPELRFPSWLLGDYLEFEPSIRYIHNIQWLDEPQQERDRQYKKAYEVGTRLSATAERIYDFEWRNTRKLKHKMSPVLTYKYRVHHDKEDYRPWFESIDAESKINGIINEVALSLENFLDARMENNKDEVSYSQWATFNLSQGYDIDEARRHEEPGTRKKPFKPLNASANLYLPGNIDVQGSANWDHYEHEITSASLSLDLSVDRSGGREDTYRVDYQYARDNQKNLNLWLDVYLTHGFSVGSSLERDLVLDQSISNSYWLRYQRQCWGVRLVVEKEDEETRVMMVFELLGLGDIEARKRLKRHED